MKRAKKPRAARPLALPELANATLVATATSQSTDEYTLGLDNIFHLAEFAKNETSTRTMYNTGALTISVAEDAVVLEGTRDDEATVYTYWARGPLSQHKVHVFPVTGGEEYAISAHASTNKDEMPVARIWVFFYDADGNYIDPNGAYEEDGPRSRLTAGFSSRSISAPANAAKATLFFNAEIYNGESVTLTKIRVIKASSYFDPTIAASLHYVYSDTAKYGVLPTPTRTGYTFTGWNYAENGTGATITADTAVPAESRTAYAQWAANTYTITFDANGGTTEITTKSVTYAATYGELPVPTRTEYVFTGWYTAVNGGELVTATTAVNITGSITLYARWRAYTFSVSGGDISRGYTVTEWHNENALRAYPLTDDAKAAKLIPTWLITDLRVTVDPMYQTVFLSSVYVSDTLISVGISGATSSGTIHGLLTKTVTRDELEPARSYSMDRITDKAAGAISFGEPPPGAVMYKLMFTPEDAPFAASAVLRTAPPAVTRIIDAAHGISVDGIINLSGNGEFRTHIDPDDPQTVVVVLSDMYRDLSTSVCNATPTVDACGAIPIRSINGVTPDAAGVITIKFR